MMIQKYIKSQLRRKPFLYKRLCDIKLMFIRDLPSKLQIYLLHIFGYKIISGITTSLENTNLKVFCTFGTLLGIIRDKDFIVCDNDLDFGIVEDENFSWDVLDEKCSKLGMKLKREFYIGDEIIERAYTKKGIGIDFFKYIKCEDQLKSYEFYRLPNIEYSDEDECSLRYLLYPKIESIQKIEFKNSCALIPKNYERILACSYGEGWRIYDPNFTSIATVVLDKKGRKKVY